MNADESENTPPAASDDSESDLSLFLKRQTAVMSQMQAQLSKLAENQAVAAAAVSRAPKEWSKEYLKHQFEHNCAILAVLEAAAAEGKGNPEGVLAGVAKAKESILKRNADLERENSHPGFLRYADEFRKTSEELKKDEKDGALAAFLKQQTADGILTAKPRAAKRFRPFQAGGPAYQGGLGVAPSYFPQQGPGFAGAAVNYQLHQPPLQPWNHQQTPWSSGGGTAAPPQKRRLAGGDIRCYYCHQRNHVKDHCPLRIAGLPPAPNSGPIVGTPSATGPNSGRQF